MSLESAQMRNPSAKVRKVFQNKPFCLYLLYIIGYFLYSRLMLAPYQRLQTPKQLRTTNKIENEEKEDNQETANQGTCFQMHR